jgi:hypothetical protein
MLLADTVAIGWAGPAELAGFWGRTREEQSRHG